MVSFKTWFDISGNITQKLGGPVRQASAPLSTLLTGNQNSWGEYFVPMVNEARALAEKHVRKDKTLQFVDLSNFGHDASFFSTEATSLYRCVYPNGFT
jgi:hypothetical protein